MTRAVYIAKPPLQGSRYKFIQMFARYCELDVRATIPRKHSYDFAIARGDRSKDYLSARRAGLPYILIEHDVWSIRAGIESDEQERDMIEGAAAVLFNGPTREAIERKYLMPPSFDVRLRPLASDIEFEPLPKLPGRNIVYAGGIIGKGGGETFGYRKYHGIFKRLIECGWTVHIYPAWGATERGREYADFGCVLHDPVPQSSLYRELSQYQAGFMGYSKSGPQRYIRVCRPNKTWEYLAAGIPTFGYNTGPAGQLFDGRWGHVARTLADFPATLKRVEAMKIPDSLRREQVIDADADSFRAMVDIAAAAEKHVAERTYTLGVHVADFQGREWPKGCRITYTQALALKAAGHIKGKGLA